MPHVKELPEIKRVYLIGIGGTAMASLAGMLEERGYEVGGSDEHVYPPMSTYLEQLRIPVLEGYTKEHLLTFRPDLVVIGNVAAVTNAEAAATVELDLPYTSMPEAIYELFIKGKHSIVVTGTRTPLPRVGDPDAGRSDSWSRLRDSKAVDETLPPDPSLQLFRRSSSLVADPSSQRVNLRGIGPSGVSRALCSRMACR